MSSKVKAPSVLSNNDEHQAVYCSVSDDSSSIMSSISQDSNNTTTEARDCGINTDDTIRLIPFEVDHWATKCIRLADEFQTSKSFEDAQSNISDLAESLEEYLKLRTSDGALRVDILIYVVLTNILDGIEANGHMFSNEIPPMISSILTSAFATSGQLGRYGFQSYKQSVKLIKFLKEFYKKNEITPQKLPIILWQSVKKISIHGTTLYPTLYLGEFHFHLDSCPDSESCKTVRIDFSESNVFLKYCTSTSEIIEVLKGLSEQELDFGCDHVEPSLEIRASSLIPSSSSSSLIQNQRSSVAKNADIGWQQMISCDIDLSLSANNQLLSDISTSQPKYSEPLSHVNINRGGSIILRFKSRYLNQLKKQAFVKQEQSNCFVLGTKQYWQQHSQILLVDTEEGDNEGGQRKIIPCWLIADLNGKKVQEAQRIEDIHNFKWDIKFGSCEAGCWTNAEILFVDNLKILPLLEECSISFENHLCNLDTHLGRNNNKCSDCLLLEKDQISVDQVFDNGSVQINVRLDLKLLGFSKEESGNFALFKFALSLPVNLRQLLIQLQNESKLRQKDKKSLFNHDDFQNILKLWEQHKNYYYAIWYSS